MCLFTPKFPPLVGGAETYVHSLAKAMARFGHEVYVVTGQLPGDIKPPPDLYPGFEVLRIPYLLEFDSGRGSLKDVLREVHRAFVKIDPDIIHAHNFFCCLAASMVIERARAKLVFTYYDTPPLTSSKFGVGALRDVNLIEAFVSFIFRRCPFEVLIALSRCYEDYALTMGVPKHKLRLVYPGVDTTIFSQGGDGSEMKARIGFAADDRVVCCPVRIIPRKGLLNLVCAMAELEQEAKLFITGGGVTPTQLDSEYYERVVALIEALELQDRVSIGASSIVMREMPEVYAMSDLVVLPSQREGLGLILLEALASGVPVVATRTSGVSEVISDGQTGMLVEPNSPFQLARAIDKLLAQPRLAKQLSEKGRKLVEAKFNLDVQARKIERIYRTLLPISERSNHR